MRVLLHTGKGGVGKTTLALATALGAARHGHRVCVLSTDPAHSLGDALGERVGPNPKRIADGVYAREIRAQVELDRAWQSIQNWLRELLREEADELVAEELLAFPGIEELVALRAVHEVEETGDFDVCVVDCAPTGSTMRMLRFPDALRIFMQHFFAIERKGARLLRPLVRGFEAGRLMATFRPDVVLLDLRMPGLDGFQVCRTIKADPESSPTIVVAMTGYFSPETESRILECGAVRCFAKPVEPSTLSAFIDSVLAQQASGAKARRRRPSRS